jgi:hypothetical protein
LFATGVEKVNGVLEGSGRGVVEEDFTETAELPTH